MAHVIVHLLYQGFFWNKIVRISIADASSRDVDCYQSGFFFQNEKVACLQSLYRIKIQKQITI